MLRSTTDKCGRTSGLFTGNCAVIDSAVYSPPTWYIAVSMTNEQSPTHPNPKVADRPGGFYRSMQHHLVDLLLKDGVYERRKTIETFSHAENRNLEPLEVRAVVA